MNEIFMSTKLMHVTGPMKISNGQGVMVCVCNRKGSIAAFMAAGNEWVRKISLASLVQPAHLENVTKV